MAWRRDRSAVASAPATSSSGRRPAKAPTTSARVGGTVKAVATTPSRKSISASLGVGTSGTGPVTGSSVSPT